MNKTPLINRRNFIRTTGVAALAGSALPVMAARNPSSELLVKKLYDNLNEKQRKSVCFDWDYKNHNGLLRKHISNNWLIHKRYYR